MSSRYLRNTILLLIGACIITGLAMAMLFHPLVGIIQSLTGDVGSTGALDTGGSTSVVAIIALLISLTAVVFTIRGTLRDRSRRWAWVLLLIWGLSISLAAFVITVAAPSFHMLFKDLLSGTGVDSGLPSEQKVNLPDSLFLKVEVTLAQPQGKPTTDQMEARWEAPDKLRTDMIHDDSRTIQIFRSDLQAIYSSETAYAIITPSTKEPEQATKALRSQAAGIFTVEAVKKITAKMIITGQENILRRTCNVIEWSDHDGSHFKLWADQNTGITLKLEEYHGKELFLSEKVTQLEIKDLADEAFNPESLPDVKVIRTPVDSKAYTESFLMKTSEFAMAFSENAGMTFEKLRDPSDVTMALSKVLANDRVHNIKREVKALYKPEYVPSKFRLVTAVPVWVTVKRGNEAYMFDKNRYDTVELSYVDPRTGDALVLLESSKKSKAKGKPVRVDGSRGRLFTAQKPYPYAVLYWRDNGVNFTLGAVNVSESEMFKIAKSLKVVN